MDRKDFFKNYIGSFWGAAVGLFFVSKDESDTSKSSEDILYSKPIELVNEYKSYTEQSELHKSAFKYIEDSYGFRIEIDNELLTITPIDDAVDYYSVVSESTDDKDLIGFECGLKIKFDNKRLLVKQIPECVKTVIMTADYKNRWLYSIHSQAYKDLVVFNSFTK